MQSYAKEIEFFTIQISEVCLQLKILSTLLLCDNILDLLPQLIAHSFFFFFFGVFTAENCQEGWILSSLGWQNNFPPVAQIFDGEDCATAAGSSYFMSIGRLWVSHCHLRLALWDVPCTCDFQCVLLRWETPQWLHDMFVSNAWLPTCAPLWTHPFSGEQFL